MNAELTLSQKIYLLGIHPKKGGIISTAYTSMDYCLLSMLLLELFRLKKIRFVKKRVEVIDAQSENDLHRFLLQKMSKAKRNLRISTWINKFYFSFKFIRKAIQQQLAEQKLIKLVPKKFLFFRWLKPHLLNKEVVIRIIREIDAIAMGNITKEEDIYLLTFIKPAGLLRRVFPDREKRKHARKRINSIMRQQQPSIAIADAVSASKAVIASLSTVVTSHHTFA